MAVGTADREAETAVGTADREAEMAVGTADREAVSPARAPRRNIDG
ncbi:MAG: hypothetical protein IKI58_08225 [Oscillospiraceae bacterium]|nr:hypothetical protein [Oscillospiraceae bacterium]